MKKRIAVAIWLLGFLIPVGFVLSFSGPMTVCLTFDDGFRSHATIAAPRLEEFGWRASFAIVTSYLTNGVWMTEEQVVQLKRRGHAIYPHSVSHPHPNLHRMVRAGQTDEVRREIVASIAEIDRVLGERQAYFVYPENDSCPETDAIVYGCGVKPYMRGRHDFGDDARNVDTHETIEDFLSRQLEWGSFHVDLMAHGIVREDGGWHPFISEQTFVHFLDVIKALEKEGRLRVVDYEEAPWLRLQFIRWLYSINGLGQKICEKLFAWRRFLYG